jgi:hypothetical protein
MNLSKSIKPPVPLPVPRGAGLYPYFAVAVCVIGAAVYVNAAFDVTNPDDYRYFPPFRVGQNNNQNDHLGAEYLSIAKALYREEGFASPFQEPSGATAWMPPVLPAIQASLLWASGGDVDVMMNAVLFVQSAALIAAGWLVLAVIARRAKVRWVPAAVYAVALIAHFRLAFQITHDHGLILLVLTTIFGWACFGRPLASQGQAIGWGVLGGLTALTSPVLGASWAALTMCEFARHRRFSSLLVAVGVSIIVVTPWTIRNYVAFGRLIPIKSNLGFELHQSQCLEPDGVLRAERMFMHPYSQRNTERREYLRLGEMRYLEDKMNQFISSVQEDPVSFVSKVFNRLLASTLVYVPLNEREEEDLYLGLWLSRLTHPLPFLSLVFLLTVRRSALRREQWVAVVLYATFLLPYVLISYYDRYAFPLIPIKVLFVVWGVTHVRALER